MKIRNDKALTIDPRTKILLVLLGNILLFSYGDSLYLYLATLFALGLMVILGEPRKALEMTAFYVAIFALSYIIGFAPKTISSIWGLLVMPIIMFMPLFALAYLLFATTEISEMITALQRMKIPSVIITPLIVMFRFFPTIRLELMAIRDAMKLKGVKKNPVTILENIYVPILFNCVKIGEDLNISGLTRGLGLHNTSTQMVKLKFNFLDLISVLLFIVLILLRKEIIIL